MKKTLLAILCLVLISGACAGGAWAASVDGNVTTITNNSSGIGIELNGKFDQTIMPGVEMEKEFSVTNQEDEDAWVWIWYLVPAEFDEEQSDILQVNVETTDKWSSFPLVQNVIIEGEDYNVYTYLYENTVSNADTTNGCNVTILLDSRVDYNKTDGEYYLVEDGKTAFVNGDLLKVEVPVTACGIQKEDFETAQEAYKAFCEREGIASFPSAEEMKTSLTKLPDGTGITEKVANVVFGSFDAYSENVNVAEFSLDIGGTTVYYLEDSEDDSYTIYFLSNGVICAPENCNGLFSNMTSLVEINTENLDTSLVTDMSEMFRYCSNLKQVDVSNWNTSNVTTMYRMFQYCTEIETLDLSNWDVSNVTNMKNMFYSSSSYGNMKLTSIGDVSGWNTENVTNMYGMFCKCANLESVDVSGWDLSQVTDTGYMFSGCASLESLDVSTWNLEKNANMKCMFYHCTSLEELDVADWETGNVINFAGMFCGNDHIGDMQLKELNVSDWDMSKATDIHSMFYGCGELTTLDLSKWDVSNVTTMSHLFADCNKLSTVNMSGWDTSSCESFEAMFNDCWGLKTLDVSMLDTQNIKTFSQMFETCKNMEQIIGLENFETSNATRFYEMFSGCASLQSVNLSSFDTTNIDNMYRMFNGCSSLVELDLSNFDTKNVTNMTQMFCSCSALKTIYVSERWDVSQVTDFSGIFEGCTSLVGGCGTAYQPGTSILDYAQIDEGETFPGYFTYKK